jgi:hypothetical protein
MQLVEWTPRDATTVKEILRAVIAELAATDDEDDADAGGEASS